MNVKAAALRGLIYPCVFFLPASLCQSTAGPPPAVNPAGEKVYRLGVNFYKQKRFDEALQALTEARGIDPSRGAINVMRGIVFSSLRRFPEAIADADMGIRLARSPQERARALFMKGNTLLAAGRTGEALRCFTQTSALDPTNFKSHYGKGRAYMIANNYKRAAEELGVAIKMAPSNAPSWALLAECQYHFGELEKGMQYAEKAVRLDPKNSLGYRARAMGFQRSRKFEEMLADATLSLQADPAMDSAHIIRGSALQSLGRYKEALEEYTAEPNRAEAEPFIAKLYLMMWGPLAAGTYVNNPGCAATNFATPYTNTLSAESCGEIHPPIPIQASPPAQERPKPGVSGVPTRPSKKK